MGDIPFMEAENGVIISIIIPNLPIRGIYGILYRRNSNKSNEEQNVKGKT